MYCKKCGNITKDDSDYCVHCGNKTNIDVNKEPIKIKLTTAIILFISLILVFGIMCIFLFIKKDDNGSKNTNKYESVIISKWKETLPLNSTKGLECALYSIETDTLYLYYDMGVCIIDNNNVINRYIAGESEYILTKIRIDTAKSGDETYIYMTPTEFESLISKNNND